MTIDTTGANLLVAWVAVDGADPTAPTGANCNPNWQVLPVYANAAGTHGRFFYAANSCSGSQREKGVRSLFPPGKGG